MRLKAHRGELPITNVIHFPGITTIEEDPAVTLEKAKNWGLACVVIVGFDSDGKVQKGASFSELGEIILLLEAAKQQLLTEIEL